MEIITITCKGEGNWKRDMKIKVENDSKVLSFVSPDEQRHRDWPRKRLTLEEWDNLETFVCLSSFFFRILHIAFLEFSYLSFM
eukprot:m.100970 g.100970  ORF g.100970 m.100970 type:complete len:83 (+) comp13731_c0_seq4:167-415(+)